MEYIITNLPAVLSAVLLIVAILTAITNIAVQVIKKATWDKIPTNLLAVIVAMTLTLAVFLAFFQIEAMAITWYMVAAVMVLGLFVAYAAMFGFDKFREALEQIGKYKEKGNTDL